MRTVSPGRSFLGPDDAEGSLGRRQGKSETSTKPLVHRRCSSSRQTLCGTGSGVCLSIPPTDTFGVGVLPLALRGNHVVPLGTLGCLGSRWVRRRRGFLLGTTLTLSETSMCPSLSGSRPPTQELVGKTSRDLSSRKEQTTS